MHIKRCYSLHRSRALARKPSAHIALPSNKADRFDLRFNFSTANFVNNSRRWSSASADGARADSVSLFRPA